VETAIWDRERGRENELALHNAEQAVDEWAARGFTLPPGALAMRVRQANQDAINKTATQSRDRAIENARINIESVRFAVGQAIQLRLGAVQAAFNYIRTWFLVPQTAIEKAKALTDARLRFYASTSAYYNALIGAAQAKITAQAHNQGAAVSENRTFGQVAAASVESRTGAALSAAQAMGMCAAGALASINTLANVGHNTAAQE